MPYVNDTGLPSVTDIIRPYINTEYFTEEHSDRGGSVHAACAAYLLKLYCPSVKPEWQGYVQSAKKWIDDVVEEVVLVEKRLVDVRLGFCGKPDFIIRVRGDNGLSLPDLKTGASLQLAWRIQSAAYRHLAKVNGIDTIRGFPVRPKANGSGVLPVDDYARDYRKDFNIFMGLLNAYNFFNRG